MGTIWSEFESPALAKLTFDCERHDASSLNALARAIAGALPSDATPQKRTSVRLPRP